jgi:hypothetical protein
LVKKEEQNFAIKGNGLEVLKKPYNKVITK